MQSKFWQFIVNKGHGMIMDLIRELCAMASNVLKTKVEELN